MNRITLLTKKKRQPFGQAKNSRRSQQEQIEHKRNYSAVRFTEITPVSWSAVARAPSVRPSPDVRVAYCVPGGTSPTYVVSPLPIRLATLSVNLILEGNVRGVTGDDRRSIATIVCVDVSAGRVAVIRGGSGERAISVPECPVLRVRTPASDPAIVRRNVPDFINMLLLASFFLLFVTTLGPVAGMFSKLYIIFSLFLQKL